MQNRLTDVVKNLLIINVLVFLCAHVLPSKDFIPDLAFYHNRFDEFKPYQIVTYMFDHAGFRHLIFNMLGLFFLGPFVEKFLGAKRFLILYLTCGFVALASHYAWQTYLLKNGIAVGPVVGASGCVYGVLIAFAVLFPNVKLMLLFPPIPIKARYLAIGLIALDIFQQVANRPGDNVAHIAHLGGAFTGAFLIWYWYKRK